MYKPIKAPKQGKKTSVTTLMGTKGINLRDLPQLLSPEFALIIKNYILTSDGGLQMRNGMENILDESSTYPITMLEKFNDDTYIFAYDKYIKAYTVSTGGVATIKTYTPTSASYSGNTIGDYFFVTNGLEEIGRISATLAYDAQSANFTVGTIITGGTSGATAVILKDVDAGATGTLTLGNIVGVFINNELITDTITGSATANGVQSWAYTKITGSPICRVVRGIGNRLYAGDLNVDPTGIWYSNTYATEDPPFTTWTVGTLATDPGRYSQGNGGRILDIIGLGNNIVAFQESGKFAFYINTIDSSGTLTKIDVPVIWRTDFGIGGRAIVTPKGVFYVNKAGLWQLVSIGQANIPFSDQEGLDSILLGSSYFVDKDLSNTDITYYAAINMVLVTCMDNSDINNLIICYNTNFKSFTTINGWNIERFMNDNQTIYGARSNCAKIDKLFTGWEDDGKDIWTEYYQELKCGDLQTRQILYGGWIDGFLSSSTDLTVAFDIYDVNGYFIKDKIKYIWIPLSNLSDNEGYGDSSFGESGYGGTVQSGDMIECFDGFRQYIRNFQRIRIRITGIQKVPHTLVWVRLDARPKIDIRRRKMTLLNNP